VSFLVIKPVHCSEPIWEEGQDFSTPALVSESKPACSSRHLLRRKARCWNRIDLVVDDLVVVELKSVDAPSPVHHAQVISCVNSVANLSGCL
jgi:hypothetical protein